LCFASMTIAYLFGTMITATGNLKKLNIIYGIGVLINWGLNLYLIPDLLAKGAAYTTLITQLFVLLALVFVAFKDLKWRLSGAIVFKTLTFVGMSVVIFIALKELMDYNWVIELSFSALLCFLVSFLFGFIRLSLVEKLNFK